VGHDAANLGAAAVVVISTAVKRDNPEVVAARTRLTLGLRGTGVVEVKSGLAEGDTVVPATEKVAEGDRVKPTATGPVRLSGSGMGR